jgi:hypothetical protein
MFTQPLPNVEDLSFAVMGSASYHSVLLEKIPTAGRRKVLPRLQYKRNPLQRGIIQSGIINSCYCEHVVKTGEMNPLFAVSPLDRLFLACRLGFSSAFLAAIMMYLYISI